MSKSSQMHSAEHLLNQAMVRRFGCGRCFSAHINSKKSKCDYHFDRELTLDEMSGIEGDVNAVIDANLTVEAVEMPKEEAMAEFNLARVPDQDQLSFIRVVCMGDYDACPCIGEHVASTAEIGRFVIVSASFDGGVLRIRFKLR